VAEDVIRFHHFSRSFIERDPKDLGGMIHVFQCQALQ
jgi:hypothetical protein